MNDKYEIPSIIIQGKENLELFREFLRIADTTGEDFAEVEEILEEQEIKNLNKNR